MDSWYTIPSGNVGRQFTDILATEWRGSLGRICNSEMPLVFVYVVLTKTLGVYRFKEIRAHITRWMEL